MRSSRPAWPRSRNARTATKPCTFIAWRCSTKTCTTRPSPGCARRWATPRLSAWQNCRAWPRRLSSRCLPRRPASAGLATRGGFAFDNELGEHPVALAAFEIDATPVTAGRYLRFVEAGGYADPAFWPGEAGRWRATQPRSHPARWRRVSQQWETRWFDRWLPLDPDSR